MANSIAFAATILALFAKAAKRTNKIVMREFRFLVYCCSKVVLVCGIERNGAPSRRSVSFPFAHAHDVRVIICRWSNAVKNNECGIEI